MVKYTYNLLFGWYYQIGGGYVPSITGILGEMAAMHHGLKKAGGEEFQNVERIKDMHLVFDVGNYLISAANVYLEPRNDWAHLLYAVPKHMASVRGGINWWDVNNKSWDTEKWYYDFQGTATRLYPKTPEEKDNVLNAVREAKKNGKLVGKQSEEYHDIQRSRVVGRKWDSYVSRY